MSTALLTAVNDLDLPPEPGISPRAARTVLHVYCKIAQTDGTFRYGLRGSKIAALADYSLATIRRVQRYLVSHGFLEKIQVGGGRASTRWRIILDKLGIRHSGRPAATPQPDPGDTAQEREPKRLGKMFSRWRSDRDHAPGGDHPHSRRPQRRPEPPQRPTHRRLTRSSTPANMAAGPDERPGASSGAPPAGDRRAGRPAPKSNG